MARNSTSRIKAAAKQLSPEQQAARNYRRRRLFLRGGQILMALGAVVLFQHWLTHLEAFGPGQPPLWLDMLAGYPMGVLLLVLGAVLAGTKPKTS